MNIHIFNTQQPSIISMDESEINELIVEMKSIKETVEDLANILDILHKEMSEMKKNMKLINTMLEQYQNRDDTTNGYMHG